MLLEKGFVKTRQSPSRNEKLSHGKRRVQKFYDILKDPEGTLDLDLSRISIEIRTILSEGDVKHLTALFHALLVRATRNLDGTQNPFAIANLKHVSLHYRDIENARNEINDFFKQRGENQNLADIALLNAAAHDIGKVAEILGIISLETKDVYDAVASEHPSQAFFLKTILGHDGLTMDGIEKTVSVFAKGRRISAEKAHRLTSLLQAASARHNGGYGELPNDFQSGLFHFWQLHFPQFANALREQGIDVPNQYPTVCGGWVPVLLALIDRGTSLHPSFIEKIANEGDFELRGDTPKQLICNNARSVMAEIDCIGRELQKYITNGKSIAEFSLYKKYAKIASLAESAAGDSTKTLITYTPIDTSAPK